MLSKCADEERVWKKKPYLKGPSVIMPRPVPQARGDFDLARVQHQLQEQLWMKFSADFLRVFSSFWSGHESNSPYLQPSREMKQDVSKQSCIKILLFCEMKRLFECELTWNIHLPIKCCVTPLCITRQPENFENVVPFLLLRNRKSQKLVSRRNFTYLELKNVVLRNIKNRQSTK